MFAVICARVNRVRKLYANDDRGEILRTVDRFRQIDPCDRIHGRQASRRHHSAVREPFITRMFHSTKDVSERIHLAILPSFQITREMAEHLRLHESHSRAFGQEIRRRYAGRHFPSCNRYEYIAHLLLFNINIRRNE